jgi:hypothetical protein
MWGYEDSCVEDVCVDEDRGYQSTTCPYPPVFSAQVTVAEEMKACVTAVLAECKHTKLYTDIIAFVDDETKFCNEVLGTLKKFEVKFIKFIAGIARLFIS